MIQAVLENQPGPGAQHRRAQRRRRDLRRGRGAARFKAGVERATQAIKSGAAKQKLEAFVAFTQKLKQVTTSSSASSRPSAPRSPRRSASRPEVEARARAAAPATRDFVGALRAKRDRR